MAEPPNPPSDDGNYKPISDYGLIGDCHSAALVSKDGSVDWCCFPRFDSPAVFSRILDHARGGYFQVAPKGARKTTRRYLPGTNVLETTFHTDTGVAQLTDFMPIHPHCEPEEPMEVGSLQRITRILKCISGSVEFQVDCYPRFDYGTIIPHAVLDGPHKGFAHGGASGLAIYCSAPLEETRDGFRSQGLLRSGERVVAATTYQAGFSHAAPDIGEAEMENNLAETVRFWQQWAACCTYEGEYRDDVLRSALTLKALTYAPSGAVLAAATTSLPETIGGSRNWDYRYTWIRDAVFALYALSIVGYTDEARAFKDWLEWSTSGRARDLQVMYGLGGERRLTEVELPELDGYRGSRPVRIGNGAYSQFQLDIYGEIMDSAHLYRKYVGEMDTAYWQYLLRVVSFVIDHWREPDEGIWEMRNGRQHFVFSKVMCWVALDRAIKAATALHLPGDVGRWREVRSEIRQEVLSKGYDADRGALRPVLRVKGPGCRVPDAPPGGIRPRHRPQDALHHQRHRARADLPRGVRISVQRRERRPGGHRGGFHHMHLLARRRSGPAGTVRPGQGPVRPREELRQRPGLAQRGNRAPDGSPAWQLPPGLLPHGPHQHRRPASQSGARGLAPGINAKMNPSEYFKRQCYASPVLRLHRVRRVAGQVRGGRRLRRHPRLFHRLPPWRLQVPPLGGELPGDGYPRPRQEKVPPGQLRPPLGLRVESFALRS